MNIVEDMLNITFLQSNQRRVGTLAKVTFVVSAKFFPCRVPAMMLHCTQWKTAVISCPLNHP
ncbi:hypothetical protein [Microseira wollei]|uniref:hypothetical protein n=1 Tax=Microseira wollei TaxID=467598 RepID=UPI001CFEC78B|nr:hypothetical protein [Microseira wollei]